MTESGDTQLDRARASASQEAIEAKNSMLVVKRLRDVYSSLSDVDRRDADARLSSWVLSDDESLRFDALALIGDFQIRSAIPSMRRLEERLRDSERPGAPYERRKVLRKLETLSD